MHSHSFLLQRLLNALAANIKNNLFDPAAVLKKFQVDHSKESVRVLDSGLLEFLKESRCYNSDSKEEEKSRSYTPHTDDGNISTINYAPNIDSHISVIEAVLAIEDGSIFVPILSTSAPPANNILDKEKTNKKTNESNNNLHYI